MRSRSAVLQISSSPPTPPPMSMYSPLATFLPIMPFAHSSIFAGRNLYELCVSATAPPQSGASSGASLCEKSFSPGTAASFALIALNNLSICPNQEPCRSH